MKSGLSREEAIKETKQKFDLDNSYLEGVVPKFGKVLPFEPEKKKGRLIGKPDGGSCFVTQ